MVREARESVGMSQREIAKLLKVPFRTYQSWEIGDRRPKKGDAYLAECILALGTLTDEGKKQVLEGNWDMDYVLGIYKQSRTQELSEWGRYGATYEANRKRIPGEIWNKLPAEDLAKLVDVIKAAYDDGVAYGRKGE